MARTDPSLAGLGDDDHHPDNYAGGFQLHDLHRYLRRVGDQHIRAVEELILLRMRGYPHGECRRIMGLSPARYREVNRAARDAVAAITLRADDPVSGS